MMILIGREPSSRHSVTQLLFLHRHIVPSPELLQDLPCAFEVGLVPGIPGLDRLGLLSTSFANLLQLYPVLLLQFRQ